MTISRDKYTEWEKLERKSIKNFKGAPMKLSTVSVEDVKEGMDVPHSNVWRNRRPICPYGCGQEGNLLEVIVKDGKGIGIYTHAHAINPFTADLQMSPKPTGRKIVIGPDGEPQLKEETNVES